MTDRENYTMEDIKALVLLIILNKYPRQEAYKVLAFLCSLPLDEATYYYDLTLSNAKGNK